jgi:hypothetical protein
MKARTVPDTSGLVPAISLRLVRPCVPCRDCRDKPGNDNGPASIPAQPRRCVAARQIAEHGVAGLPGAGRIVVKEQPDDVA